MKILKLHESLSNSGGIVSFQEDLNQFSIKSKNSYLHFRTGRIENHIILSNQYFRILELAFSYFYFPIYLMFSRPDVIEINSSLVEKSFFRDLIYIKLSNFFLPKAKTIGFIHGWDEDFKFKMINKNKKLLMNFFKSFDQIIVLAEKFKNDVIHEIGVKNKPINVIRTGIKLEKFQPSERKSDAIHILFLSRIEVEKGIFEFLRAIPKILEKYPNLIIDIAGNGDAYLEVKNSNIAREFKNNIKFHGYILGEEKTKLFQQASIYVFPSYTEGCPVSVLEAMAIGIPIIYTDVGALPELLEDQINGLVIPIKEVEPISDSIFYLLQNEELRKMMGKKNTEKAVKEFSIEKIFNEIEDIYEQK